MLLPNVNVRIVSMNNFWSMQVEELQKAIFQMPSRPGGTPEIFEAHADPPDAPSDDEHGCEVLSDEPEEADPVDL